MRKSYSINMAKIGIDEENIKSPVLYENYKRKNLTKRVKILLTVATIVLFLIFLAVLSVSEYFFYYSLIASSNNTNSSSVVGVCDIIWFGHFQIIQFGIAFILIVFFVILFKRRSFLVNKYKFRYIGIPMIVSVWSKNDRFETSMIYGKIAYDVFGIFFGAGGTLFDIDTNVDPSGILALSLKILNVLIIGVRYYPILVAIRAKETIFYMISAVYMSFDLFQTIFWLSVCIPYITLSDIGFFQYLFAYQFLMAVPSLFFTTAIFTNLSFKAIRNMVRYLRNICNDKNKSKLSRSLHSFFNIDTDNEIFYCHRDIEYVLELFDNKEHIEMSEIGKEKQNETSRYRNKVLRILNSKLKGENHKIDEIKSNSSSAEKIAKKEIKNTKEKSFFRKNIYDWQPSFKFSSRFVNVHLVALVALIYFFLTILYEMIKLVRIIQDNIPDDFNWEGFDIDVGSILCTISQDLLCIDGIQNITIIHLQYPQVIQDFGPILKSSLIICLIVPCIGAFFLCLFQFLYGIKDCRTNLLELYKGDCEYLPSRKTIANNSIAGSSFHFGGYLTGFLIWGYLILFAFLFLVSIAILFLRMFVGVKIFKLIALKIVPVLTVFIITFGINQIASRYLFLHLNTKILAVDNFRAFNVFLYFSFFYDCFMGVVTAVLRVIKTTLAGVFFMSRISYGFMGRKLERMDSGYSTYVGFLYMEASHTNPILLSFCSVLYYKGLSEHILRIQKNKKKNTKYIGILPNETNEDGLQLTPRKQKNYNKIIVNRWHVMVMLVRNPTLVFYRKNNDFKDQNVEVIEKEKTPCCNFLCFKRKIQSENTE